MALFTVFLVVLIDLMGFGIVLPLLPFYASKFGASPVAIGLLYSIYSLMQLVFSPLWGGLSDRVGRRPIMLISTFGAVIAYIIFGFAGSFFVLFFSRMLAGIMGGNIATAQAYVADVTTPEERARGMGLIGAAFGIGFTAGPALATLLGRPEFLSLNSWFSEHRYALPGLFAAGLSLLSFLLIVFKLPETVGRDAVPADTARVTRPSIFQKEFWAAFRMRGVHPRAHLLPLLFLGMLLSGWGHSSLYSAFPLYCKDVMGLTAAHVGMQFVWLGFVTVVVQGGMIRPLVKRFGERDLFLAGSVFFVAGIGLIPTSVSPLCLYVSLGLLSIGAGLITPTVSSLISKESEPQTVGATLGAALGMASLGRVIGPTWGGFLYGLWAPLPFLATAAVCLTLVAIAWRVRKPVAD